MEQQARFASLRKRMLAHHAKRQYVDVPHRTTRAAVRQAKAIDHVAKSHECWRQLHQYAIDHAIDWDESVAKQWFAEWEKTIPRHGCKCDSHWKGVKKKVPPKFNTAEEFYLWTIDAHNEVNRLLGKQRFSPDKSFGEQTRGTSLRTE